MSCRFLSLVLASSLLAGSAHAATIFEGPGSDGFQGGPVNVGNNVISGSLSAICTESTNDFADCAGDTNDAYGFLVPDGFEVTGVVLSVSNFLATGDVSSLAYGNLIWSNFLSPGSYGFFEDVVYEATDLVDAPSLSGTNLRFFDFGAGYGNVAAPSYIQGFGDVSFSYSLSFDITPAPSPVPLPAGFPLLLTAMAGLGVFAGRRSKVS